MTGASTIGPSSVKLRKGVIFDKGDRVEKPVQSENVTSLIRFMEASLSITSSLMTQL